MTRLVIDTDPGVDDARAMMMAFAYPGAQVEALTVVAGNVDLERTRANACTVLDILGVPEGATPIFAGCDRALLGQRVHASYVHGADGLGNSNYPPSPRRVESEHAVNALIRLANASPGELTLVAIGPLTNVAMATRLDPTLPKKYKQLVVMGGAIRGTGNMASNGYPTAEFNAHSDPEAAHIVFENWTELSLISWETTLQYFVPAERLAELMSLGTPRSEFFARITRFVLEFVRQRLGRDAIATPDELAMAVALEPEIVTRAEMHAVKVELAGPRGQTTVDWFNGTDHAPNMNVILEINHERFWEMLRASVA